MKIVHRMWFIQLGLLLPFTCGMGQQPHSPDFIWQHVWLRRQLYLASGQTTGSISWSVTGLYGLIGTTVETLIEDPTHCCEDMSQVVSLGQQWIPSEQQTAWTEAWEILAEGRKRIDQTKQIGLSANEGEFVYITLSSYPYTNGNRAQWSPHKLLQKEQLW